MRYLPEHIARHYLYPGLVFASKDEHLVSTVLGSCVAVCLYDETTRIGGVNHYLLPFWNGEGLPTPRYGNIAIDRLIERMFRLGANREHLVAKLFGGGNVLRSSRALLNVGERNVLLAEQMLELNDIPIVSSDTGGTTGRKIVFNTSTGIVLLGTLTMEHMPGR